VGNNKTIEIASDAPAVFPTKSRGKLVFATNGPNRGGSDKDKDMEK
jgi:hypothetical protein